MTNKLKPCPFCGGEATVVSYGETQWAVACNNKNCLIKPIVDDWIETEEQAIKAWNTRYLFDIPDGYIVLPLTKLDEPKPVYFESSTGIGVSYDLSLAIGQYSKYISDKMDHEFVTSALNRAGWVKERTCRIEPRGHILTLSDGTELYESCCSECSTYIGEDDNYCPGCGAKVVE